MAELSEIPTPNYEDYEMLYQIGADEGTDDTR
jgi:hypothetical protein